MARARVDLIGCALWCAIFAAAALVLASFWIMVRAV